MGGTYKKKIRSERSKIKLKGSKLSKNTNVTQTDFKVRKIIIRTQLRSVNTRGQQQTKINEILSRMKHHNSIIRLEALRSLNSAFTLAYDQFEYSGKLNAILQNIAAAALDLDKEVRRESFKTLNSFLSVLKTFVAPFFPAISSYLQCAMTHIQPTIKDDSLLMLDILLQQVPSLIAAHGTKILTNFLEMMSHARSEEGHKGRTLTILNKGNKQTSIHWRLNALDRLQQMLKVLVVSNLNSNGATVNSTRSSEIFKLKELQYFVKKPFNFSQCSCDNTSLFQRIFANDDKTLFIRNCIEQVMPLLFEAWQEVRPSIDLNIRGHVLLTEEAANTLKFILEIMVDLWNLVDIHESLTKSTDLCLQLQNYSDTFAANFLQAGFPFERCEESGGSHKKHVPRKKLQLSEQFCTQQNINISYLLGRFSKRSPNRLGHDYGIVLKYLNKRAENFLFEAEFLGAIECTLQFYLKTNCIKMHELHSAAIRTLLSATIEALLNRFKNKDQIFNKILILISGIVQDPITYNTYGPQEFLAFIEFLPRNLLSATIPKQLILAMVALGKQMNMTFLFSLNLIAKEVIENIQRIKVTGVADTFEDKKQIINLFYWMKIAKVIDMERQKELLELVHQKILDKQYFHYFEFVLK